MLRASVVASLCLAAGCQAPARARAPEPATEVSPGPARAGGRPDAALHNQACEGCHVEIAVEWRASLHRQAFTDPEFARALAREPQPFCRGCHAPEADPAGAPPAELAALGVGCVTCHAPPGAPAGAVLAASEGTRGAGAHAVIGSAAFAGPGACAGCHEFDFLGRPGAPMQLTAREHAASRFADTSCAGCHMPWAGEGSARHRSHRFAASRDPAVLRASLQIAASRRAGVVALRLEPAAVGHAVPTGDLFRRLLVEAEAIDAAGEAVSYDVRTLGRRFERRRQSSLQSRQIEVGDDRPGAPGRPEAGVLVELELGAEADAYPVRWRVVHQRVEFYAGHEVVLAGEVEVAAGELPPRSSGG